MTHNQVVHLVDVNAVMYISGKSQMDMLQVLCNTFIAIVT